MITDAILGVAHSIAMWMLGLFPEWDMPDWFTTTIPDGISTVASYMTGLDPWIPFAALGHALALIGTVLVMAVVVRIVRIVASFLTAGGGSAG